MKSYKNQIIFYFIIYLFVLTEYHLINLNKLYEIKGKTFNFIEDRNFIQKQKLYISIDFGNYKTGFAYKLGENNNDIYIGKMQSIPSVVILNKSNFVAKNYG